MTFDVIVVGAGSAGAVVARRVLDAGLSVLVLEAGGRDANPAIHDPARVFELWHTDEDWDYRTVPQAGAAGRSLHLPRGRVLGGSHALNGMINVRGTRHDYDRWAAEGAAGWSWDDVLPFFRRLETHDRGASEVHGGEGPVHVSTGYPLSPVHAAIIDGAQECGIKLNSDPNGGDNEGVSKMELTLRDGARLTSWTAYVGPVLGNRRLSVATGAQVHRLVLEGDRVVGVDYVDAGGVARRARAERQVVLSAGALGTPALLLRSGIGPAQQLRAAGVDVRLDLPGVGANLQDHLLCPVPYGADRDVPPPAPGVPWAQSHWFAKSDPSLPVCDTQPINWNLPLYPEGTSGPANGFTLMGGLIQPFSRGSLSLAPDGDVLVDVGALSDDRDLLALEFSVRQVREVGRSAALAAFGAREVQPGPRGDDPAALREHVRRTVGSYHHQVGTAKMGVDAASVVDPRLALHGLSGLRVVDASVMPTIPAGNTNTPTIMIGERGAHFLLQEVG
ncbi:oxidoreductase [Kineococcus sp. R8]|uniref:GMC family oxidoreductase n=1 Tax=Kineococcus siccus TaxID=2696567 RepID=UPI001411E9B3|nr:GMC family oxidoreductase N-terminal domain-containing protein [Kineococcus siccus]NAZ80415.1 oxidoreductase [Kineococcus siccus]